MSEQERQLRELEEQIPLLAAGAFAEAYQQALQSGATLVSTIGSDVFAFDPDGSRHWIKTLEPAINVTPGTKVKVK